MKHLLITTIAAVVLVATTAFADPIHDAARTGNLNAVQTELDKGVDVNARDNDGWPPLHRAAWNAHKDVVELLIANGVEVNAKNEHGHRPLDAANATNHPKTTDLLRKHGAKTAEELKAEGK